MASLTKLQTLLDTILRLPYSIKGDFEEENKANHDIVEKLYIESSSLSEGQKEAISIFIQYYKRSPQMENPYQFNDYKKQLAIAAQRFPNTTSSKTREYEFTM
jgi:hypothetical protein